MIVVLFQRYEFLISGQRQYMEKPKRTGGGGRMGEDMDWVGCGARCGTDHLPEIGPAGLPFLVPPPPIHEGRQMGAENNQRSEKRMLIFNLNC